MCHGSKVRALVTCLLVYIQLLSTSAVISRWIARESENVNAAPFNWAPLGLGASGANADNLSSPLAGCEGLDCVTGFVALPDDSYSWYDTGERIYGHEPHSGANWTGHILNMTSQRWGTEGHVQFPLWWHILVVVVPNNLEFKDWASLSLDFGMNLPGAQLIRIDNRDNVDYVEETIQACITIDGSNLHQRLPQLKYAVSKIAYIATNAHTIGVSLLNLPNSYEVFKNDKTQRRRSMDFLKAYAYFDFLSTGANQPERISELPIAKAFVRAMDTVQAYTEANLPSGKVMKFGVTGYSKLGTIAFMAGGLDPRVKAIAPAGIALDMRNGPRSSTPTQQYWQTANLMYAPVHDYLEMKERNLMAAVAMEYSPMGMYSSSKDFDKLHKIVDPAAWGSRLKVPKLFIMATNDFCFQSKIDDTDRLFNAMPGQKTFLEIPNCKHEDTVVRALPAISAFFHSVLLNKTTPEILSEFNPLTGLIKVQLVSDHKPYSVTVWTSDSNLGRDWKEAKWSPRKLPLGNNSWQTQLVKPFGTGYRAGFIQFKYAFPDKHHTFSTSTPVSVVPSFQI